LNTFNPDLFQLHCKLRQ